MQFDELDVLGALTNLLKTLKETKKIRWPTYASVLKMLDESDVYQNQKLTYLDQYKWIYNEEYCSAVFSCILNRLAWSDMQLLLVTVLATHGWKKLLADEEKLLDENSCPTESPYLGVERLLTRFSGF